MSNKVNTCTHCGAKENEVKQLIQLSSGACLCDVCIGELHLLASTEDGHQAAVEAYSGGPRKTPKEIVSFLDNYVVGQTEAKKTLAIAVCNHYKRLDYASALDVELDKSNVLLLGPTGTGKTLLASTIAKLLDVPFTIADATSLTQAGYVGDDVETILQRLIQAADGDIQRAERGIVFIDEIDKVAKANSGASITRDVSGEGVQQALLKIIEGARVSVPNSGSRKTPGAQMDYINTKNILFICAGAFVKLLDSLDQAKKPKTSLGFVTPVSNQNTSLEVTPELLFEHGMIPEFIGRLPVIATLEALDVDALERILTEPKNALVRQLQALFRLDGAMVNFEPGAIRAVAEQAYTLKTGARGARSIMEKLLKNALFEVPGTAGAIVTVSSQLQVTVTTPEQKNR